MQKCVECERLYNVGAPHCDVHNRLLYGVYIAKSTIANAGNGLFAARSFKPHEPICPWEGEIISNDAPLTPDEEEYVLCTKTHIINPYRLKYLASIANTAASKCGTKSIRKGCNAENVLLKNMYETPWIVAIKHIQQDEEILCFYGREFRMRANTNNEQPQDQQQPQNTGSSIPL